MKSQLSNWQFRPAWQPNFLTVQNYPEKLPFSLVVTIEKKLKKPTVRIYDELTNINFLDNILESDIDLNQENDLEIQ